MVLICANATLSVSTLHACMASGNGDLVAIENRGFKKAKK